MSDGGCPNAEDLSRALLEGADAHLEAHLIACAPCQREWDAMREVDRLARELPWPAPDAALREALRARILAAAAGQGEDAAAQDRGPVRAHPRRRWAVAAVAAVLLLVGLLSPRLLPDGRRATVQPLGEARLVHGGPPEDEVVRLMEGGVLVEVRRLRRGERFRLVTGAGEVEVRGTMFEARADGDRLTWVRVLRGVVDVRVPGQPAVTLRADERWQPRQETRADAGPGDSAAPAPTAAARAPTAAAPRQTTSSAGSPAQAAEPGAPPEERAFGAGFRALRAGRYLEAAQALDRLATAGGPLAEDAAYWGGVAWARAGRSGEATRALQGFLSRHPGSARAGEAEAELGWIAYDAGRLDEARRRFEAAVRSSGPRAKKSGHDGLAALARRKAP